LLAGCPCPQKHSVEGLVVVSLSDKGEMVTGLPFAVSGLWSKVAVILVAVFTSRPVTFNSPVAAALTPGIEFAASTTFFAILSVFIDFSIDLAELASGVWILASTLTLPGVRVTETVA